VVHAEVGAVGASSSAASASSIDCSSESAAVRTCEWGDGVQWPNDRNPILFTCTS
jgi:hypothetical protein